MTDENQPSTFTQEMLDNAYEPDEQAHDASLAAELVRALAPNDVTGDMLDRLHDGTAEYALEGWEPLDIDSASWAARHLARRQSRIAEVADIASEQRARIDQFEHDQTERLRADATYFEMLLRGFHAHALAADPRAKTVRLPDGTELRSQAGKKAVEVTDVELFQAWAEENGLALELFNPPSAPAPNKAEIGKRFGGKAESVDVPGTFPAVVPETGELIPGVEVVRKPRTFTVGLPR